MQIGIIGGAGYIGSALIGPLVMRGHQITVFDTFWFGDYLPKSVKRIQTDARKLNLADFLGLDAVVFLAGLSNDPMADFNPLLNFELNGALPAFLVDLARRAKIKTFIHGGSCSVYGRTDETAREDDRPLTNTPYGVSKLLGELACMHYSNHMRVVCFRMGTVCGYSPRMRYDLVINAMVKDAMTKHWITVNDSTALRPILDMHDAVRAYIAALTDNRMAGVFNIATENANVMDLALTVQKLVKDQRNVRVSIEDKGLTDIRSYSVDFSRAAIYDVAPKRTLTQTAEDVLKHFSPGDCTDDRYYNINVFKKLMEKAGPSLVT